MSGYAVGLVKIAPFTDPPYPQICCLQRKRVLVAFEGGYSSVALSHHVASVLHVFWPKLINHFPA